MSDFIDIFIWVVEVGVLMIVNSIAIGFIQQYRREYGDSPPKKVQ